MPNDLVHQFGLLIGCRSAVNNDPKPSLGPCSLLADEIWRHAGLFLLSETVDYREQFFDDLPRRVWKREGAEFSFID